MGEPPQGPSEQDVRDFLDAIARTRVGDVLLQTALTLSSLGSARLGVAPETRPLQDLDEARAAIEALRALLPSLQQLLAPDEAAELRQTVAGLQMAYAQVVESQPGSGPGGQAPPPPPQREPPPRPEPPRPKIWTPRGDV